MAQTFALRICSRPVLLRKCKRMEGRPSYYSRNEETNGLGIRPHNASSAALLHKKSKIPQTQKLGDSRATSPKYFSNPNVRESQNFANSTNRPAVRTTTTTTLTTIDTSNHRNNNARALIVDPPESLKRVVWRAVWRVLHPRSQFLDSTQTALQTGVL
jgi:hypothetical protein